MLRYRQAAIVITRLRIHSSDSCVPPREGGGWDGAFGRSSHAGCGVGFVGRLVAPAHKGPRVEDLIKAAGAELRYLPPYRPDMNPIEKVFSKLKAHLRKIAERSVAGLIRALQVCADIFLPAECQNYFAACGYDTI